MKDVFVSFVILFFFIGASFARQSTKVTVSANEHAPFIGSPVTLTFEVKSNDISTLSWKLCDSLFTRYDLVNFRDSVFMQSGTKVYRHTAVFTSVKPGIVKARAFRVILTYRDGRVDSLTSNLPAIRFRPDGNLLSLHQIKPVAEPGLSPFKLMIALLTVAAIVYVIARYVLNRLRSEPSPADVCNNHLKRIEKLKLSALDARMQADMGYRVLMDFLECTSGETSASINSVLPLLQDGDRTALQEIIHLGDNLRFGAASTDASEVGLYLAEISSFISQFHSLKFAAVYE